MKEGPGISQIGALIGDPARANMLTALMGGQALTATELAGAAGVTLQTASAHLAKLEAGGLQLEQVDFSLPALLDSVVSLITPAADAKGLQLRVAHDGCPDWLRGAC